MGLRHQEDLQPGSSRHTPWARTTLFSGKVLAGLIRAQALVHKAAQDPSTSKAASERRPARWMELRDSTDALRTQRRTNLTLSPDTYISGEDHGMRDHHVIWRQCPQKYQPGHREHRGGGPRRGLQTPLPERGRFQVWGRKYTS